LPHILLLQLKRIGDAVLTAPTLATLRAARPDARLTLALAGAAGALGPLFADADEILTWAPGGLNLPFWNRLRTLEPDVVLDFSGNDRSALLSLASRAPVRAGYEKFASKFLRRQAWNVRCGASVRDLHTIDFHHALAAAAGFDLPAVPDFGHLKIPPGLPMPDGLPDSYAVVHPGTAREDKFWPPEHWAALLDHLHHTHRMPLVLTGGTWDFETGQIREILRLTQAPVLNLAGRLTLSQLAAVIARASLAVTVDTAAMHLAAAFRIPQAGLFGPTNPWHWAPRHPRAVVLRAGYPAEAPLLAKQAGFPMIQLAAKTVSDAVDRLVAKEKVV
jgi:ADP-heptose:LPS heptosyltransferase